MRAIIIARVSTLRQEKEKLTAYKAGKQYRIKKLDLDKFIERRK